MDMEDKKMAHVFAALIMAVNKMGSINTGDLLVAMQMIMGHAWTSHTHMVIIEGLIDEGMLAIDEQFNISTTDKAKELIALDEADRRAVTPNMQKADA